MTMQTFIVFIVGMAYGWKLAFSTLVVYLFEGALGLPVFAKGGAVNRRYSNKLMRYRVITQAMAVLIILAYVLIQQRGI